MGGRQKIVVFPLFVMKMVAVVGKINRFNNVKLCCQDQ